MTLQEKLQERVAEVRRRMAEATARAGRAPDEVNLVAVTKKVDVDVARTLIALGERHLGENRPQELWRKAEALADEDVRWELIGHLQRNKIDKTLPLVSCIHSVDSERLLDALETEAGKQGLRVSIFLEVNASGEEAKHGFEPAAIPALSNRLKELQHLRVLGLMTMAAFESNPEDCRGTFRTTRELLERLRDAVGHAHPLNELSMGMSNDFEVAIEEGATRVRIGSTLYEGLDLEG